MQRARITRSVRTQPPRCTAGCVARIAREVRSGAGAEVVRLLVAVRDRPPIHRRGRVLGADREQRVAVRCALEEVEADARAQPGVAEQVDAIDGDREVVLARRVVGAALPGGLATAVFEALDGPAVERRRAHVARGPRCKRTSYEGEFLAHARGVEVDVRRRQRALEDDAARGIEAAAHARRLRPLDDASVGGIVDDDAGAQRFAGGGPELVAHRHDLPVLDLLGERDDVLDDLRRHGRRARRGDQAGRARRKRVGDDERDDGDGRDRRPEQEHESPASPPRGRGDPGVALGDVAELLLEVGEKGDSGHVSLVS